MVLYLPNVLKFDPPTIQIVTQLTFELRIRVCGWRLCRFRNGLKGVIVLKVLIGVVET